MNSNYSASGQSIETAEAGKINNKVFQLRLQYARVYIKSEFDLCGALITYNHNTDKVDY